MPMAMVPSDSRKWAGRLSSVARKRAKARKPYADRSGVGRYTLMSVDHSALDQLWAVLLAGQVERTRLFIGAAPTLEPTADDHEHRSDPAQDYQQDAADNEKHTPDSFPDRQWSPRKSVVAGGSVWFSVRGASRFAGFWFCGLRNRFTQIVTTTIDMMSENADRVPEVPPEQGSHDFLP